MSTVDRLAPIVVESQTRERSRLARPVFPAEAGGRWGGPARFNFAATPGPGDLGPTGGGGDAGTGSGEADSGEDGNGLAVINVRDLNKEIIFDGVEEYREFLYSSVQIGTELVEIEAIRSVTFFLGERKILHETKSVDGSVTTIWPVVEKRREYLKFIFPFATGQERGAAHPEPTEDPPEIATMYSAPAEDPLPVATGDPAGAPVPAPDAVAPDAIDLGAFRTLVEIKAPLSYIWVASISWVHHAMIYSLDGMSKRVHDDGSYPADWTWAEDTARAKYDQVTAAYPDVTFTLYIDKTWIDSVGRTRETWRIDQLIARRARLEFEAPDGVEVVGETWWHERADFTIYDYTHELPGYHDGYYVHHAGGINFITDIVFGEAEKQPKPDLLWEAGTFPVW